MMASKARLFGDDTALSTILASDDPREKKRLGRHVRHFDHELWQSECKNIVLHGNLAKFSQNEEMHLALIQTGDRHLAEASPHNNPWGIGLSACNPRASSPDSWCCQNLLGQALEYAREILRRDITAPLFNPAPETPVPRDDTGDTVFEVDPVIHLRLDTDPLPPTPKRPRSRLSPIRYPTTTPQRYFWPKNSALMRLSYLNKALI